MVLAAQTVSVVPTTAKKPTVQCESTGANHHPPAAVKITVALKRGLVKEIKSEVVDMRKYIAKPFGGHLSKSELNLVQRHTMIYAEQSQKLNVLHLQPKILFVQTLPDHDNAADFANVVGYGSR